MKKFGKTGAVAALALCALAATAQTRTVQGTVRFRSDPAQGVEVTVAGSETSARTDREGRFSIPLGPKDRVLVFRGDAMEPRRVRVSKKKSAPLEMEMKPARVFRTKDHSPADKTGSASVAVIDPQKRYSDDLSMRNIIEGQAPGVVYRDGYVYIRGLLCRLYLVDGARVDNLRMLDPGLVDKIEVVKDATGGIYGRDASHGVVLITTKK